MAKLSRPLLAASALCVVLLSGCATSPYCGQLPKANATASCGSANTICGASAAQSTFSPVRLRAVGYGSPGNYNQYTPAQQKLMAIRASQIDAYRNLAEQVQGFRISGSTTVSAFAVQSDTVRSYVDSYIKGARVVNTTSIADGNYQTEVELDLTSQFSDCLSNLNGCAVQRQPTGCVANGCTSPAPSQSSL